MLDLQPLNRSLTARVALPNESIVLPHPLANELALALNRTQTHVQTFDRGWALPKLFPRKSPDAERVCGNAAMSAFRPPGSALAQWIKHAQYLSLYQRSRAEFDDSKPRLLMVWNGFKSLDGVAAGAAKDAGYPVLHMELTPFPGRLSMDLAGINTTNSLPRRADYYRDWAASKTIAKREPSMGGVLVSRQSTRADVRQTRGQLIGAGKFVFVPLQVPQDTQVRLFGGWINSVEALILQLSNAASALPNGWHLRLKEHPSAKQSLANVLRRHASARIVVDNETDTFDQVAASEAILTINSSVGLQAYAYQKPVLTLGDCFWNFGGMALGAGSPAELADYLSRPTEWDFDADLRAVFLQYCQVEHFPREADILSGQWTLQSLIERDEARINRLEFLDGSRPAPR